MPTTIYCINWQLFKKHDPDRKTHIGPPLYTYDHKTHEKRPYTKEEANDLARTMNRWATRGHHTVAVYVQPNESEVNNAN